MKLKGKTRHIASVDAGKADGVILLSLRESECRSRPPPEFRWPLVPLPDQPRSLTSLQKTVCSVPRSCSFAGVLGEARPAKLR